MQEQTFAPHEKPMTEQSNDSVNVQLHEPGRFLGVQPGMWVGSDLEEQDYSKVSECLKSPPQHGGRGFTKAASLELSAQLPDGLVSSPSQPTIATSITLV